MTPQKQEQTNPMFHYFQMEDLVPEDHILRQIDEAVDFSFVRDHTAPLDRATNILQIGV